jgi:protein phosphatase
MVRAGAAPESLQHHRMRHVLTKALGSAATLDARAHEVPLDTGDLLLLCSDGLYGPLGDDGIARVLAQEIGSGRLDAPSPGLERTASALVDAANAAGGPDNVTVVLVRYTA